MVRNKSFYVVLVTLLFMALNVSDTILTDHILAQGGKEVNPFARWIIEDYGIHVLLCLKIFVSGAVLPPLMLFKHDRFDGERVAYALLSIMGAIVAWNGVWAII